MATKAIKNFVYECVDSFNEVLAKSTCPPDVRQGVINSAQKVLMQAGLYEGFRYLPIHEVPKGHRPGINLLAASTDEQFDNCDETRVHFFVGHLAN
jgi:hypothetical protein